MKSLLILLLVGIAFAQNAPGPADVLQVTCSVDKITVVLLAADAANLNDPASLIGGSDPTAAECKLAADGADFKAEFPYGSCNPSRSSTATDIVLTYTFSPGAPSGPAGEVISRNQQAGGIEAKCEFPRNSIVSQTVDVSVSERKYQGSDEGNFIISMTLATADGPLENGGSVDVDKDITAAINFTRPFDGVASYPQTCRAMDAADPDDASQSYLLFEDRCTGSPPDMDGTVVFGDQDETLMAFTFKSFVFTDPNAGFQIYLFCDIVVCITEEAGNGQCVNAGEGCTEKRRDVAHDHLVFEMVSVGFHTQ